MATILYLIRHHWLAFGVLVTAAAVAVFFLGRMTMTMVWFNDPAHRDQDIAAWMTPRYVAMSYRLPREMMFDALDLRPGEAARMTLQDLAEQRNVTVEDLSSALRTAIEEHRK